MSAAYQRGKGNILYVHVPLPGGQSRIRSTGTDDAEIAADIEAALAAMRRKRMWRELAAVAAGRPGFSLDDVRDAWAAERLSSLTAQLDDIDLAPYVAKWQQALRVQYPARPRPVSGGMDTPTHYLRHVRTLISEGTEAFPRSGFTADALTQWLAERPGKPGTRARYHAAMSSFAKYLVKLKVLATSPMRDVPFPKVQNARTRHLELGEVEGLLGALPEPWRAMSALAHGTGMEVSALAALRRRDVDLAKRTVHARGSKTEWRNRVCAIDAWAIPYISAHCAALLPSALVFPELSAHEGYDHAARAHAAACRAVGIEDYHIHDARHSYAVRYIAAGAPAEFVSGQLGHKDTRQVNERYGRFKPSAYDVERYQRMAEGRDADKRAEEGK